LGDFRFVKCFFLFSGYFSKYFSNFIYGFSPRFLRGIISETQKKTAFMRPESFRGNSSMSNHGNAMSKKRKDTKDTIKEREEKRM